ncbi:MAG: O-antigen ligase family protein [Anaerolineae bacterium]
MAFRVRPLKPWRHPRLWWLRYQKQLWRWGIIAGLLFFSAVFSFVLPERFQKILLVLPFAAGGVMLLFRWPPLGFILLLVATMGVRIWLPPVGITAAILMGLTGLWIVDMAVRKRKISIIASPTIWPLIFFVAVTIFAFLMGQLPWFPTSPAPMDAQIGGLFIFVLSFCAFLLTAHQIRETHWLKWLVTYFLIHGGLLVFVEVVFGIQVMWNIVPLSLLGGSMYWTWLIAMSFSQAMFNKELKPHWRILLALIVVGVLYLKFYKGRGWSSGWIPGLIAIAAILWVARPRTAVLLSALALIAAVFAFPQLYNLVFVGDNQYSATTRVAAWQIVFEIARVNPILGLGPANYYFYTPLFNILGWHVQFNSHNNYVDIIAQTGILGLACFVWFVTAVSRMGWRLRMSVPTGGFEQAFVYGTLGGLMATVLAGMLGDWVLPFVYNIGLAGMRASILPWLFLGGMLALEQIIKAQKAQS